jgi:dipeptidase E
VKLLLLSNSRTANGFLVDYLGEMREFAAGARRAAFLPFASVTRPWPELTAMLGEVLAPAGIEVEGFEALERAELILVSGGNTFRLLHECRKRGLLDKIRERVKAGTPYIGWSAGANLACPTIRTTNDMPIVDPGGLEALGLLPFQLNCHYTSQSIPGHHGETRDERLIEFSALNPDRPVLALPEGDWLRVSGQAIELKGPHEAFWFRGGGKAPVRPGPLRGT